MARLDTTARLTGKVKPEVVADRGHSFKFSAKLQLYYCRHCGGVRSPKLGKLNK